MHGHRRWHQLHWRRHHAHTSKTETPCPCTNQPTDRESLVQRNQLVRGRLMGQSQTVESHSAGVSATFEASLTTRIVDQNTAHGLGRGSEEVPATVPVLALDADKSHVCLVNERRGL